MGARVIQKDQCSRILVIMVAVSNSRGRLEDEKREFVVEKVVLARFIIYRDKKNLPKS